MKKSGKKEIIKFQFYLHMDYGELSCRKLQIIRVFAKHSQNGSLL